ncbi:MULTISPECIES: isocitrate lyase/phosphoenolpyruvate mutase family protein [Paraburkholderia]|uniref:isocitrate lyase/PEP mutase family protein n=1 Tax=Paraburkholderia TaxID=1822464 RepID=UPI001CAFC392|nr:MULTISPECIES: isocitrate lyase/phosphoenolpyruvate mutase family protein [Paraburkholderia]BEU26913.1 isocitrate lyase/phosphoenolpyruvate mutase family protein [Paraburkholderia sp. 22B1P]GJH00441.1 isocitrate lyase/phosphoenolpyruvate mutase family protein [Paraburkholderia terrae]GJH32043.1 isocitrate lyase/phosphoenolpyruvate mutase family protein [Paraburkholderia hospita]CAG9264682.1 2,3-dimethylmalate lyase [Paraburkholderia caribensis]
MATKVNALTTILEQGSVLAPGVFDALTALIAEQAGFKALYLSGASIAYTRLGRSDVGLTTSSEVEDTLARITERVDVPLIVDADTGFGNALNVKRTVRGFERAGAAMIQLEDQTFPKRCGHLDGKSLIPAAEMCGKLRAAVDARSNRDTMILARTDAVAVEGLDAALDRAEHYLEAGADALFIEALRSVEQMKAACDRFAGRVPLLANMVEGGKTPVQSAQALTQLGFRIVIFPGGTARAVAHTLQGYYASLREHGTTYPWKDRMLDFDGINEVIGTQALMAESDLYS